MKMVPIITPDSELKPGEIRVLSLTTHGEVFKGRDMRGPCFAIRGTYKLADGTERPTAVSAPKKKELPAKVARKIEEAAMGAITLTEYGESVKYRMG